MSPRGRRSRSSSVSADVADFSDRGSPAPPPPASVVPSGVAAASVTPPPPRAAVPADGGGGGSSSSGSRAEGQSGSPAKGPAKSLVCPHCDQAMGGPQELSRHVLTHSDAPFPGIKVRQRGSVLRLNEKKKGPGDSAESDSEQTVPLSGEIHLPPLSEYMSNTYWW